MSMPVRSTIAHFSLPFGRTLNTRRAAEANQPRSRCVEKFVVEPSVCTFSLLTDFSTKSSASKCLII